MTIKHIDISALSIYSMLMPTYLVGSSLIGRFKNMNSDVTSYERSLAVSVLPKQKIQQ
jgi:hypothetical protein